MEMTQIDQLKVRVELMTYEDEMLYYITTKAMPENSFVKVMSRTRVAAINCFVENYYDDLDMIVMSKEPEPLTFTGSQTLQQYGKTLKATKEHYKKAHEYGTTRKVMLHGI